MKDFFKSLGFKVLAAVALLLVGVMIYAASTGGLANIPATITGAIVSPLQSLGASISNGFSSFLGIFTDSGELQKEIDALQEENNQLRQQQVELDELRRENEDLRKYLGVKEENPDYEFVPAKIIAQDPSDPAYNFSIGKGSLDGIHRDDPVITPEGLVGVVYEVYPNWAKVRTILDPNVAVSAIVSRTSDTCITGGTLPLAREGLTRLNMLPRETGATVGDYIVTAGKGGIYPPGLRIGKITEIKPDSDGLTVYATIEPFADIRNLSSVFVITNFAEKNQLEE